MNPETLASLQTLEKELERLRSAVEHIDQAKAVAQKVVGAVALIQKKYGEHLDALLDTHREAAEKLGEGTQERFEEAGASARRHILESAARAKKYLEEYDKQVREALEQAGSLAGERFEEVTSRAAEAVDGAVSQLDALTRRSSEMLDAFRSEASGEVARAGEQVEKDVQRLLRQLEQDFSELNSSAAEAVQDAGRTAAQHLTDITARTRSSLDALDTAARKHIEEIGVLAQGGVKEVAQLARTSVEDAGSHAKKIFAAIKKTHDQQITEFEKVTVSTDALIAASGKLVRTIDSVDFPQRLQTIENDIRSVQYNFNSAMTRIDALEKSTGAAMAGMADEMVTKIGRVEAFTDKTVRTLSDNVERRFDAQEKAIGSTRLIVVLVLLLNLLMAAGLYMIWSGATSAEEPLPVLEQPADTVTAVQGESAP